MNVSLTSEQVDSFKINGFLVLEDFIAPDVLELWRSQMWTFLESEIDDRASWPTDREVFPDFRKVVGHHDIGRHKRVAAIVRQMGQGIFVGSEGTPVIRWPDPDRKWQMPRRGHVDGYSPRGWSGGFMFGATVYLYDVEAGGGAVVCWPKSHLAVHKYFRRFPEHIDGSFMSDSQTHFAPLMRYVDEQPRELVAKAGTVIFWHGYLVHCGSINTRKLPRIARFGRWRHPNQMGIQTNMSDDLWEHWSI